MNSEMDRRTFLKIGLGAIGGVFLASRSWGEVQAASPKELSFNDIRDFSLRMDKLSDSLPDLSMPVNETTIAQWTQEVIPHYQSEGFIDKAIYPSKISFDDFTDDPLNIEGATHLCTGVVNISSRMVNPMSVWYNAPDARVVITHEEGHVQQKSVTTFTEYTSDGPVCNKNVFIPNSEIEMSAQVGTIEVLAGMSLEGNKYAAWSLVGFLKELSMNSAHFLALKDKKLLPQYQQLEKAVYRKETEKAYLVAAQNFVRGHEDEYNAFLEYYNYNPLKKVMVAVNGDGIAHRLIYPHADVPMDDIKYFLFHAERLTKQLTA